ncbi:MAG: hypothetical protein AAFN10_22755, partial [Bacteroidota bacterium]
ILAEEGTRESFHEVAVEKGIWDRNFHIGFINENEAFGYLVTQEKSLSVQKINLAEERFIWSNQFSLDIELEDEFENFRLKQDLGNIMDRVVLKTQAPIFAADASIYLVGDTYTVLNASETEDRSFSGDIIAIKISAAGELDWQKTIKKGQKLTAIYTRTKAANLSFSAFLSPEQNLTFIYNDCARNYQSPNKYKLGYMYTSTKSDAVSMCQLNPTGNVQYRMLYDFRTRPFDWAPSSVFELAEGQYIIYAFSRKKICVGRLSW